ncbi:DUF3180 domain-containing protein [Marinactinospora thermotolerans]|uniref:DUF3180 domain-containing protein n=1 Tax=Marinactinospora thermotolerans DSM 45154 TaxID=1122192 RepID=A0A1T4SSG7_9ACTN|nr:DUF3180 domain-containing protein [Marinactinospora thermotolerans]SKA31127.1 Protein of unknown function [Marinactinospora thermotolerans DSM 45154]
MREDDYLPPRRGNMRPTSWRLLVGIALVGGVVAYLVVEFAYGSLPLLPWTAIPTLSLLAIGELVTGVQTRRRIRRVPGTEPVEPLSAARLVALAKASALFGALVVGVFGGVALALTDMLDIPSPRTDAITAAGTALAGGALMGAALFLEYACRVPGGGDESDRPRGA